MKLLLTTIALMFSINAFATQPILACTANQLNSTAFLYKVSGDLIGAGKESTVLSASITSEFSKAGLDEFDYEMKGLRVADIESGKVVIADLVSVTGDSKKIKMVISVEQSCDSGRPIYLKNDAGYIDIFISKL
jgi:hypothetical protein